MSNPLVSLKKSKKSPLYLPEMYTPSPSSSSLDLNRTSSTISNHDDNNKFNSNYGFMNRLPTHNNKQTNTSGKNSVSPRSLLTSREDHTSRLTPIKSADLIDESLSFLAGDSDLVDEVTTKLAHNNLKKANHNLPKISHEHHTNKPTTENSTPTDLDLMQIMMKKLKFYESKCSYYEKDSKDKEKRIKILEEKLKLHEKANEKVSDQYILELETKCLLLEQQVFEMERFLSDYGLKWVGEKSDDNSDTQSPKKDENLDALNEELNSLLNDGEQRIVATSGGATFKTNEPEKIKLVLYENGISLFNGPFRPFTDSKTQRFCVDIMDGYFPSELQNKYPEGVPFDIIDKREVYFNEPRNKVFESEGYRLGAGDDKAYTMKTIETDLSKTKLTLDEFLQKLPSCVIRNGNITNVREEIANKLKGEVKQNETPKISIIETPVLDDLKKKQSNSELNVINEENILNIKSEDTKIATLKVKCNNGETYLLKMKYSDTLKDVKNYIKNQRKNFVEDFDLVSIYPHKVFENENLTLDESKLTPNSSIMMVMKKKL